MDVEQWCECPVVWLVCGYETVEVLVFVGVGVELLVTECVCEKERVEVCVVSSVGLLCYSYVVCGVKG